MAPHLPTPWWGRPVLIFPFPALAAREHTHTHTHCPQLRNGHGQTPMADTSPHSTTVGGITLRADSPPPQSFLHLSRNAPSGSTLRPKTQYKIVKWERHVKWGPRPVTWDPAMSNDGADM
jgi:hypothetical protein